MTAEEFAEGLVDQLGDRPLPIKISGAVAMLAYAYGRPRSGLCEDDRRERERQAESLVRNFGRIIRTTNFNTRFAALEAVISAFVIGVHFDGGPERLRDLTTAARKARKQEKLQNAIEQVAKSFWASNPRFSDRCDATAQKIYKDVRARIETLPGLKEPWVTFVNSRETQVRRRFINAIAKRLSRRCT